MTKPVSVSISRIGGLWVLVPLLAALTGCAGLVTDRAGDTPQAVRPDKAPNILFIFTDDHASHAIGAYGTRFPGDITPNLDQLAADGMMFRRCGVTNSICAPSRAVILTGKHSHLNGVLTNAERFDGSQMTFSKLLQQIGYQTAIFGKWHLKSEPTGFDHYERLLGQGPYYNPTMRRPASNDKGFTDRKHSGYTTDIITDLALDWLRDERDEDQPFLMMVQHKAPHRHWQPPARHLDYLDDVSIEEPSNLFDDYSGLGTAAKVQDMEIATTLTKNDLKLVPQRGLDEKQAAIWNAAYQPKNAELERANLQGDDLVRWKYQRYLKDYLRCIKAVDENIGRMLETLDELDLSRETVVIYSSDQGFFLGEHGWFDKRFMYEECYLTPLIVRWPGVVPAGKVDENLVSNLDYAQTFLDLAQVPATDPSVQQMQGLSLVPLLLGNKPADWRDSLYYQYYEYHGDRGTAHMVRRHRGVCTDRYKLIHFYNIGEWELFDLQKDPKEMNNVASDPAYATIRSDLTTKLEQLAAQYQVPDDSGSVPYDPHGLIKAKTGQLAPAGSSSQ
ncbi:MAG: sulfatase [Planctomycetota bacterium]|nr:sulfatase [Planctomycetota bacterium]